MRILFFSFILLIITLYSNAQGRILNNNPTGLRWQQINTKDFRILFPEGFEDEAQRMANTLQHIHDPIDRSLGTKTKKATIVLQNQNSISNGFVTLGPRRSEFFTSSPQDYNFLGTNDWLNTLAVHEYRHLVQFNKSRTGFTKLFSILFGQNTQAGLATVAAPAWFWEGDATVAETSFTHSGRGRIAAFDRVFRANLLEGKRFDYHKQSLRSYKDFVPNHYVLGYLMVSHLRNKTGNRDIFADVTQKAWGVPFIPFTFSNALKSTTGKYVVEHYDDMMDDLNKKWKVQQNKIQLTEYKTITKRKATTFTNYTNPIQLANGNIVALKSGIGDIQQLVLIDDNGKEKTLKFLGPVNNSGMLSVAGNSVAWNEYRYNPRWRNQSYSVINIYNDDTKSTKTIGKNSRYHGATLSPNGRKVATIEALPDGSYQLIVINTATQEVIQKYTNATKGLLTLPVWSSDGQYITFLINKNEKKSVQRIDVSTGKEQTLISAGLENIGNPKLFGQYLIYQSDYSGIDNIYGLDTQSGIRYQVTSSKYGAYNASVSHDGKTMYYCDHTVNGLDVVSMPFTPSQWRPITEVNIAKVKYYQAAVEQEGHSHILDSIPSQQYPMKKYSRLKGIINPHSWGPFANTNNLNTLQAGIFSRDVLSTTSIFAGYKYNTSDKEGGFEGRISYQGFYPILDLEFNKGNRKSGIISWKEQTVEAGLRIPLLLTKSVFNRQLTFGNAVGITDVSDFENTAGTGRFVERTGRRLVKNGNKIDTVKVPIVRVAHIDKQSNGKLVYNHFTANFTSLFKRSLRDINSKWGVSLTFERYDRLSGDFEGGLTAFRYQLFFPGLMKHHSFHIRGGIQIKNVSSSPNIYAFPNRIFKPRGHSYFSEKNFQSVMLNYTLPLWYPDLSLGPLVNIKRIKVNLFADLGWENLEFHFLEKSNLRPFVTQQFTPTYSSFGAELTFDINVMRALPELEIGARFVYANPVNALRFPAKSKVELIIGRIRF